MSTKQISLWWENERTLIVSLDTIEGGETIITHTLDEYDYDERAAAEAFAEHAAQERDISISGLSRHRIYADGGPCE